jgi:hypothetical protein
MKTKWLVQPLKPHQAHIYVRVGKKAKLTPQVKASLERLARSLHKATHAKMKPVPGCPKRSCPNQVYCAPLNNCRPKVEHPCAWFESCRVE